MDDDQINVIQLKFLQGLLNDFFRPFIGFDFGRDFGRDEKVTTIDTALTDAFAHSFMAKYISCFDDFRVVTAAFTDNEIGDIMEKANKKEITWEINVPAVFGDPVFHKRYVGIGRETGAVFNIGTDAHKLCDIDVKQFIPELKRILY